MKTHPIKIITILLFVLFGLAGCKLDLEKASSSSKQAIGGTWDTMNWDEEMWGNK